MVENLKVSRFRNGDSIPNVIGNKDWAYTTTEAYCNYENNVDNADIYGLLYNWYAVNDSRNIAPVGWHVPSDEEWQVFEIALGMSVDDANLPNIWRGAGIGTALKVESVSEAIERFVACGGTVVESPVEIPIGWLAVVSDPWRNHIVLLDSSKGRLQTDADHRVTGVSR